MTRFVRRSTFRLTTRLPQLAGPASSGPDVGGVPGEALQLRREGLTADLLGRQPNHGVRFRTRLTARRVCLARRGNQRQRSGWRMR